MVRPFGAKARLHVRGDRLRYALQLTRAQLHPAILGFEIHLSQPTKLYGGQDTGQTVLIIQCGADLHACNHDAAGLMCPSGRGGR